MEADTYYCDEFFLSRSESQEPLAKGPPSGRHRQICSATAPPPATANRRTSDELSQAIEKNRELQVRLEWAPIGDTSAHPPPNSAKAP